MSILIKINEFKSQPQKKARTEAKVSYEVTFISNLRDHNLFQFFFFFLDHLKQQIMLHY